jgi:hypothetical protein
LKSYITCTATIGVVSNSRSSTFEYLVKRVEEMVGRPRVNAVGRPVDHPMVVVRGLVLEVIQDLEMVFLLKDLS